jgi:tol-pal system protein YbgF
MATSNHWMRRYGLILAGTFALAQPAWALFGVGELATQVQALQQRVDAIDSRLGKLEAAVQDNQQLLNLLKEVETLRAELAKLRGQSELHTHQLDTLGKRQGDLYADLDQRIADLARAAAPAEGATGEPAGPVAASGDSPQPDTAIESRSYEAALGLFREASYPAAIAGFNDFLKAYPNSALAANAQYWIGYSHYMLKDYKSALANQQKLLAVYPASNKVPDALFNIAASQLALNDSGAARKTLEQIVAKHPGTQAASLAAKRLSELK